MSDSMSDAIKKVERDHSAPCQLAPSTSSDYPLSLFGYRGGHLWSTSRIAANLRANLGYSGNFGVLGFGGKGRYLTGGVQGLALCHEDAGATASCCTKDEGGPFGAAL